MLPEALHRLKQAGQRLPYELLPLALGYGAQSKEIRPALFAVLGERGRWLSQFEKTWVWVAQFLASEETLWQEGTLGQRCQILTRVRSVEPAKAREWLADVWKKEKAEARAELLATFEMGLSAEDEPFLEKALDDRSEAVREISAGFLAHIPVSAFMQRMLARADAMLTYTHGTFSITLPTDIDASWQRDGIEKPSNRSTDPQTWYARQVLVLIPPTHWEERFSIVPAEIIADLIVKKDKMHTTTSKNAFMETERESTIGELLLVCWLYAATRFESPRWVEPLWGWWCKNPRPILCETSHPQASIEPWGSAFPKRSPRNMSS